MIIHDHNFTHIVIIYGMVTMNQHEKRRPVRSQGAETFLYTLYKFRTVSSALSRPNGRFQFCSVQSTGSCFPVRSTCLIQFARKTFIFFHIRNVWLVRCQRSIPRGPRLGRPSFNSHQCSLDPKLSISTGPLHSRSKRVEKCTDLK